MSCVTPAELAALREHLIRAGQIQPVPRDKQEQAWAKEGLR